LELWHAPEALGIPRSPHFLFFAAIAALQQKERSDQKDNKDKSTDDSTSYPRPRA
jgi:hypothetical protein